MTSPTNRPNRPRPVFGRFGTVQNRTGRLPPKGGRPASPVWNVPVDRSARWEARPVSGGGVA